jgi:hypothetical protein
VFRGGKGGEPNSKAKAEKKNKKRFRSITDGNVIDLRLLLALSFAWPLSGVPVMVRQGAPQPDELLALLIGFLIGHGSLSLMLLLGKVTIWRTGFIRRHPSLAFFSLFIATVFSAILAQAAFAMVNPALMLDLDIVIIRFIILTVIFSAMTQLSQFRGVIRELEERQASLVGLIEQTESEKRAESELVQSRILELIGQVREGAKSEPSALMNRLRQMSEEVVRPWSHELAKKRTEITAPKINMPWPRWQTVLERAFSHRIIRPFPIAVLISIFSISYSVRVATGMPTDDVLPQTGSGLQVTFDSASFFQFLLELSTIFLTTYFASNLVARLDRFEWFRKAFPVLAWRAIFQLLLLTAVAMGLFAFVFLSLGLIPIAEPSLGLLFLLALPVLIIGSFTTLVSAIEELRDAFVSQLEEANQRLRRELVSHNQELLLVRKGLSDALHGPVRAALLAGAFGLSSAPETKSTLVENLVERLSSETLLQRTNKNEDALGLIRDTIELWRDSCKIDFEISDQAMAGLQESTAAASFLSQILNESVTNAITHGGAKNIAVNVADQGSNILVKVSDDGQLSENPEPGLGSELMDKVLVCRTWRTRLESEISSKIPARSLPWLSRAKPSQSPSAACQ